MTTPSHSTWTLAPAKGVIRISPGNVISSLTSLAFPAIDNVDTEIQIAGNALTSIAFAALKTAELLNVEGEADLEVVSFPAIECVYQVRFSNCPKICHADILGSESIFMLQQGCPSGQHGVLAENVAACE